MEYTIIIPESVATAIRLCSGKSIVLVTRVQGSLRMVSILEFSLSELWNTLKYSDLYLVMSSRSLYIRVCSASPMSLPLSWVQKSAYTSSSFLMVYSVRKRMLFRLRS